MTNIIKLVSCALWQPSVLFEKSTRMVMPLHRRTHSLLTKLSRIAWITGKRYLCALGKEDKILRLRSSSAFLNPTYQALPDFLSSTKFADPTDPNNTAVQHAFNAKGQGILEILMARPDYARGFGTLMNTWGEGNSLIQDLYPVKDLAQGFDPETVMFVDVGGGYGQKATALKRAVPDLPGRFIVQDLPQTIENAPKTEGIEYQAHDFFTEQPIKGARAYYIRQCLHNWPQEKCVVILSQLAKVMKPGYSKLFIHELIVPQRRAGTWMVTQDFNMMTLCGTRERTEAQWRELLEKAGLKVSSVYYPDDGVSEGIVEAEL